MIPWRRTVPEFGVVGTEGDFGVVVLGGVEGLYEPGGLVEGFEGTVGSVLLTGCCFVGFVVGTDW